MSSLHHDHLLTEGSEPVQGTGSTLTAARGTARKPAEEKATNQVPSQRQGKSPRNGSAPTVDGSAPASRTRHAPGGRTAAAAGTVAARARAAGAATGKAASAKAGTAKAATARAVTSAKAAAAAKVTARGAGARSAKAAPASAAKPAAEPAATKPAAAKPAATKPAAAKATGITASKAPARAAAAKPAAAAKSAPAKAARAKAAPATGAPAKAAATSAVATAPAATTAADPTVAEPAASRPTPFKRPSAAVELPVESAAETAVVEPTDVAAPAPAGLRARLLRRRPPVLGRRPGLYLAAALVGALSVSAFSTGDPAAQATSNVSHSVSVAEALGIEAAPAEEITAIDATQRLGELAVSRNVREAEQQAAVQVQVAADQAAAAAAAEAARPKAVLPVNGARLTSGFGARWGTLHAGIDLAAPMQTPEYAAMDGVVLEAGPASGFGLAVYIQHENGDVTVYGHMDSILVQAGQVVRAGDTIALLGNRGQSTGPHLHFEVHVGGLNGQKIDPLPWLRERGVAI
jgi:murein DD-endopeptidase MepM/ murein hydrolase activator NlpD